MDDAVRTRLFELGFIEKGGGFVNYDRPGLIARVPALAAVAEEAEARIDIYPKIVYDVFFTRNAEGRVEVGLVVDVLYTTRMEITAAEWVAAAMGDRLRGIYVTLLSDSPEAADYPEHVGRTVGRVEAIRGDRCFLSDPRDKTLVTARLTSVAPEATRTNLAAYLLARYENAYKAGEAALSKMLGEWVRPKMRFDYAAAVINRRLQPDRGRHSEGLLLSGELRAKFKSPVRAGSAAFPLQRLPEPEYSFDPLEPKYGTRIDKGLQRHGPYDRQRRRRESQRLLVVAPIENRGDVTLAMQKLLGGVQMNQPVFTGLKSMYQLANLDVTYAFAEGPGEPMTRYARAYQRALQDAPTPAGGEPRFHLVLAIIRAAHKDLPDAENPYFQMKAQALVSDHVPTQMITLEKLRATDRNLQYILNTMAFAMYAKLGGTSHVLKLPAAPTDDPTELVLGIGRSVRRDGRFGEREETVGFATVFRANGEYLFNDCTPYCADDEYESALENTIRQTVEKVAAYEQLPDGAPLRLIFHVPRRPGRREETAILNAVGKLPRFAIDFALVHVNDDHHFQVFDVSNRNPKDKYGQVKPEAALLPARGYTIAIGPRERLITFVGVDQYRGNGCPTPLRITLDHRSTFLDVDYVTKQLFWLSFMSAGSLNPGIIPVTINYASKIARLSGHLRGVNQWSLGLIRDKLGRKLWFV